MKKFFTALMIGASIFASCQKEKPTTSQVRHLDYAMCGQSMYATKAVNASDVLQAINATLPEKITICLTSQTTGKTSVGKTGEGIILPSDTYKVIGAYNGEPCSSDIIANPRAYLASTPCIDISDEITITDDVTAYTIDATYQSFALVVDSEEVEKATVVTTKGEEEISFLTSGTSKIVFGQGAYPSGALVVNVYPIDKERYKTTTYTLSTSGSSNKVEFGKYYVLHPTANGIQPKAVGYSLPDFVEGTL